MSAIYAKRYEAVSILFSAQIIQIDLNRWFNYEFYLQLKKIYMK